MQCYLVIEISDLDGRVPKYVHELYEGLVICLSQTGQGGRGHAVRPTSGVLHTKSFDEGVKDVYGPGWESTVPGQCCSL